MAEEREQDSVELRTLKRVTRMETRLVAFAKAQGVDLVTREDIVVDRDKLNVYIETLDVAFIDVVNAARKAGLHRVKVDVHCGDKFIGAISV